MPERRIDCLPRSQWWFVLVTFLSGVAHAQTRPTPAAPTPVPASPAGPGMAAPPSAPPTKQQLAEAKKFFDAGNKLMKDQLYQEALASFVEAARIAPRASIQQNIAFCYRMMKDLAAAYDNYQLLLDRYATQLKPAQKADVERALEELSVLTGVVLVNVQEPDAKVTIDGKDVGVTPLPKPIRLNIGSHPLQIAKPGFDPLAQAIEIRGHDQIPVNGPLVKEVLTGHVNVTIAPADPTAKVLVDGKEVGPAPWQGDLDPGIHTIGAKGNDLVAADKPVDVAKKGTYDVALEMKPQVGTVSVNASVPDAAISIDGRVVGTGVFEGPLPVGQHELSVVKQGYLPYKKPLLVHLDERDVENVALQKEAVAPVDPASLHDWKGVYAQLNLVGQFMAGTPTNDVAQGVGLARGAQVSANSALGGGLGIRIGYSFGFIGVEGAILGAVDHSSASAQFAATGATPAHTENWDFFRAGGHAALAVRLMPKTQIVRPTLGVGGGVSFNGMVAKRSVDGPNAGSPTSDVSSGFTTMVAPILVLDGGIELGSTPGTRFYLGALMTATFYSATQASGLGNSLNTAYPTPNPAPNLVSGAEVFIGPILGLQFGE
jgi:hypothetical protein